MIGNREILFHTTVYKGSWMVTTANNRRLLIKSIVDIVIMLCHDLRKVEL